MTEPLTTIHGEYPIVVNYTDDQQGQDIKPVDVVRPLNHRHATKCDVETRSWHLRSYGRMPTYGNCDKCYKSGPLGKYCNECITTQKGPGYVIMTCNELILDAITIAEILNKGHETAKADRIYKRGMDRFQDFTRIEMTLAAVEAHRNIQDPLVRNQMVDETEHRLHAMLLE